MVAGLARDWYHGWTCLVGFAGVNDGDSCLLLLVASVAILLAVCYRMNTCLAASIIHVDPVSQSILIQRHAGS